MRHLIIGGIAAFTFALGVAPVANASTICDVLDITGATTEAFDQIARDVRKTTPITPEEFRLFMASDLGMCPQYKDAFSARLSGERS